MQDSILDHLQQNAISSNRTIVIINIFTPLSMNANVLNTTVNLFKIQSKINDTLEIITANIPTYLRNPTSINKSFLIQDPLDRYLEIKVSSTQLKCYQQLRRFAL